MVAKQIQGQTAPDGSQYVTLTDGAGVLGGNIAITDGGGSFTVDAPVATPAFVRLSDGSAAITTLPVSFTGPATGTETNVASSATSVTILASNAARKGSAVYNDSTQILYLILSATAASTTVYTVQLSPNAYYEVPFNYTGQLTGIWASANGNARVTELT